jgi:hypothetical protein
MKKILKWLYNLIYTRKVKIVSCENPFYWYNKQIGNTFIVEKTKKENFEYITIKEIGNNTRGYISKKDVKVSLNF